MEIKINGGVIKRGNIESKLKKDILEKILNCKTYNEFLNIKKGIEKNFFQDHVSKFITDKMQIREHADLRMAVLKGKIIPVEFKKRGCFYTMKIIL